VDASSKDSYIFTRFRLGRVSAAVDHLIGLLNSYPPIDEEYALSDSKFAAILMNKAAKVVCPHRSYATGI
jgi:hypothetical protein